MQKENNRKSKIDKTIISSIYIFALGIFTSKFLVSLGMGLSILFWIYKLIKNKKDYDFYSGDFLYPILFFASAFLLSGIGHWNNEILDNKNYFSFLFFFVVINEVKNLDEFKTILKFLLFSAFVASVYGLYQYFYLGVHRISSFSFVLSHANLMAAFLMFLIVYIIWGKLQRKYKYILFLISLLVFLNVLFTKSRGAWLAFIASIFVLGIIKDKRIGIAFLVALILIFAFLPAGYSNRLISSFDINYDLEENFSNSARLGLWISSLKMLRDNPINGVGYRNFKEAYRDNYKLEGLHAFSHAHNNIFHYAAVMGGFGLITFIYLSFFILKKFIFYYKNTELVNFKLFYLGSILAFVVYHVQGMTQHNFYHTTPLHFYWFFIALTIVLYKLSPNNL